MSTELEQALRKAEESLAREFGAPIKKVRAICKAIVEEEPLDALTYDKQLALIGKLREPTLKIADRPDGLLVLLSLYGEAGQRWLQVLGEILKEDRKCVGQCVGLMRGDLSDDKLRSGAVFLAVSIRRRYRQEFADAFAKQLTEPWGSPGLDLTLQMFDTEDDGLIEPLRDCLRRLDAETLPRAEGVKEAVAAAIRRIEGVPAKRWWQFWK